MPIRIPPSLHEVFGESQTIGELLTTLLFGVGFTTLLFFMFPEMTQGLPLWRSLIAYLLILDIAAGCIANFTRSTNNHYAARDRERLVFIAVHVHLLVIAWLLKISFLPALLIWGYTIGGALIVNGLRGSWLQRFVGGTLLVLGIVVTVLGMEVPKYFLAVSLLFMVKVLFSFAVDHYGQLRATN